MGTCMIWKKNKIYIFGEKHHCVIKYQFMTKKKLTVKFFISKIENDTLRENDGAYAIS